MLLCQAFEMRHRKDKVGLTQNSWRNLYLQLEEQGYLLRRRRSRGNFLGIVDLFDNMNRRYSPCPIDFLTKLQV